MLGAMNHRALFAASIVLLLGACAKPESSTTTSAATTAASSTAEKVTAAPLPKTVQDTTTAPAVTTATAAAPAAVAMDCSTPKKTIQSQYEGIKSGAPLEAMKSCFTARQKDKITAEMLASAKTEIAKMSFEEIYASEEANGDSVKVKMKNGRSLTTLVKDGSTWKADTLWFK